MPFLDAKALETDPDGMAFLRSVIRPNFEQEEAASLRKDLGQGVEAAQAQTEAQTPSDLPVVPAPVS